MNYYSTEELERLCLDLAEGAGPVEADALRGMAQNYRLSAVAAERPAERSVGLRTILLIAAAIYAVWTPAYFIFASHDREAKPQGAVVEQLSGFQELGDGWHTTRTYLFARSKRYLRDPRPLVVYEGTVALPATYFEISPIDKMDDVWRFVTIAASDGTNPAKNGRRYYVVLPPPMAAE